MFPRCLWLVSLREWRRQSRAAWWEEQRGPRQPAQVAERRGIHPHHLLSHAHSPQCGNASPHQPSQPPCLPASPPPRLPASPPPRLRELTAFPGKVSSGHLSAPTAIGWSEQARRKSWCPHAWSNASRSDYAPLHRFPPEIKIDQSDVSPYRCNRTDLYLKRM